MDYTLEGLSPRSFEHLVQALALRHLGPGCGVWGDGPDGGRELTFDGPVDYRRRVAWDGPGVGQAKFRQRPRNDDGGWALGQLAEELDRIEARKDERGTRPFYLFATNVVLSPVHDRGAKDRCFALLDERAERLGFVDYDIWDYDKIRAFLDDAADIRRANRAWITPGDVLSDLIDGAEADRQRVSLAVSRFLQKQCEAEQYARLEQTGTPVDERVPIAQIFTDLPLDVGGVGPPRSVLRLVGDLAREQHRPSSDDRGAEPARLVLVGGPGQGKTTVGQFACQVARAALLRDRSDLTPEARLVVDDIATAADELLGGLPAARRLPFHVPLSAFAERLATGTGGLIEDLVDRVAAQAGTSFSIDDMNEVLRQYPILLVLDGLDEVPASSNRERVMQAISAFWTDCATVGADVLCIATTRPQGYTDDFDSRFYTHVNLAPLDEDAALSYAERLLRGRFGADVDRIERDLGRLRRAAGEDMTARLMTSPLQVTIMAYLVDVGGPPPRDRWNLFAAYYDVIYKRESERDNELAAVLRDHRVDVDDIHAEVGLALQVISERAGGTEARISIDALERLVAARLTSREHPPAAVERLTRLLIDAARLRLVFLVGPEADEVGFEIRSLQEFMAARALMAGRESKVNDRLAVIAPVALWRNVLLFAVGKMVVDRDELLVDLHELCLELDADRGTTYRVAGVGAQIALDVLADGSVRQHPRMRRRFTEVALGLVRAGDAHSARRLAPLLDGSDEDIVAREISAMLASGDARAVHGVVELACASVESFARWSRLLAADPGALTDLTVLVALADREPALGPEATRLLEQTLLAAGPGVALEAMARTSEGGLRQRDEQFGLINAFSRLTHDPLSEMLVVLRVGRIELPMRAGRVGHDGGRPSWSGLTARAERTTSSDPRWAAAVALVGYCETPDARSMAACAAAMASAPELAHWIDMPDVPWPLPQLVAQGHDMVAISAEAPIGRYGDVGDWIATEQRWMDQAPLTADDVHELRAWDAGSGTGWPVHQLGWWIPTASKTSRMAVEAALSLLAGSMAPEPAGTLVDAMLAALQRAASDPASTAEWVVSVLGAALARPGASRWLASGLIGAAQARPIDGLAAIDTEMVRDIALRLRSLPPVDAPHDMDVVAVVDALVGRFRATGDEEWLELLTRIRDTEVAVAQTAVELAAVDHLGEAFRAAVAAHRGYPGAMVRLAATRPVEAGDADHMAFVLEAVAVDYDLAEVDSALEALPPEVAGLRIARSWLAAERSGIDNRWDDLALPVSAELAIRA